FSSESACHQSASRMKKIIPLLRPRRKRADSSRRSVLPRIVLYSADDSRTEGHAPHRPQSGGRGARKKILPGNPRYGRGLGARSPERVSFLGLGQPRDPRRGGRIFRARGGATTG